MNWWNKIGFRWELVARDWAWEKDSAMRRDDIGIAKTWIAEEDLDLHRTCKIVC